MPLGGPWGRQGLPEELLGDPLGPFGGLAGPFGLPSVVFPLPGSPPLPPRGLRGPPLVENVPANGAPRDPQTAQSPNVSIYTIKPMIFEGRLFAEIGVQGSPRAPGRRFQDPQRSPQGRPKGNLKLNLSFKLQLATPKPPPKGNLKRNLSFKLQLKTQNEF